MTGTSYPGADEVLPSFPRYFRFGRHRVNSYKFFLIVGIYAGILVSAAVADRAGVSPLRLGAGLLVFALVGLVGARVYHLAVHWSDYRRSGFSIFARDSAEGGWSVLGGLIIVPLSLLFTSIFGIPTGLFWDYTSIAIAVGGAFIRFGCVTNGCCVGRDSDAWFALRQHDTCGVYRRRIPAQWLEIVWWIMSWAGLLWLWPKNLPSGSYAFAVAAWYGIGRFWLEPLRRDTSLVAGLRVNQVVAAVLAVIGTAGFVWRIF
jgi:prolipoprotein diacylglyceryltransferase